MWLRSKLEMLKDTVYVGDVAVKDLANVFSLSDLENFEYGHYWDTWQHVMAPGHLLARRRYLESKTRDLWKRDPRDCICFVFGGGEDKLDRATTRIGGLPFWPSHLGWPKAQDGSAKMFIGQFDFRNVVWPEPLPGDVLTVHIDQQWDGDGYFEGPADGAAVTLVWHDSKWATGLISRNELPPPDESFNEPGPFYGRSVLVTDYKINWSEHSHALTIHGMKIGGHSQLYGDNWQESFSSLKQPVFLCSIGYVQAYEDEEERAAWLPPQDGFDAKSAGGVCFLDVGTLVICYERGNPNNLYWTSYLP